MQTVGGGSATFNKEILRCLLPVDVEEVDALCPEAEALSSEETQAAVKVGDSVGLVCCAVCTGSPVSLPTEALFFGGPAVILEP